MESIRNPFNSDGRALFGSFFVFAKDIKISHSVFALPFAASALFIGKLPMPSLGQVLLLIGCMVSARSFAMGANRVLDAGIDARNDRTSDRAIPSGSLSRQHSLFWSILSGVLFVGLSAALSPQAGWCSLPLLALLAGYSVLKKFTWICHYYLGFCLGLSPIAVSVALTGSVPIPLFYLLGAITLWTGGFDILYAMQDVGFDSKNKLHSIPQRFGIKNSLAISRWSFVGMILFLSLGGLLAGAGSAYYIGLVSVAGMLVYQQKIISDVDEKGRSKNLNKAFFTANAWVSVLFLGFVLLDWFINVAASNG